MDVAPSLLHHPLDVVAPFANNVRVLCVGNVHLQSYPVTLMSRKERVGGEMMIDDICNSSVSGA